MQSHECECPEYRAGDFVIVRFIRGFQLAQICEVTPDFLRLRKFRIASGYWTKRMHKVQRSEVLGFGFMPVEYHGSRRQFRRWDPLWRASKHQNQRRLRAAVKELSHEQSSEIP